MAKENVILDLYFKTDSAEKSLTGLFGKMDAVDNSAEQLNKSFQTASKGIADSVTTSAKAVTNFNETVKGGADGLKQLATAKKAFTDISMMESVNEVEKLSAELTGVLTKSKEFNQVTKRVQQEFKKGTIDEAQALKILEDAINKGVDATRKMQTETDKVVTKTKSYRAEIQELKTLLRQPGLSGEQYVQAQTRLAQVTDAMGDQQAQIKLLASDTRGLDTAMQGLTIGVSIFASLQGASALFGSENEQVQKALLKVTAAMSLLQGLQQIQNTLDTESGFVNSVKLYWSDLTGKSLASQAVAQRIATGATELDIVANEGDIAAKSGNTIATTVYGYALTAVTAIARVTGLSMAASWAIATAGLTLIIAGVALLILNYDSLFGSTKALSEVEKKNLKVKQDINEVSKEAAKNAANELGIVITMGAALKNQTISHNDRVRALAAYNEIADSANKIDVTQIDNSALIEAALKRQTDLIIKKSLASAADTKAKELAAGSIDDRLLLEENQDFLNKMKAQSKKQGIDLAGDTQENNARLAKLKNDPQQIFLLKLNAAQSRIKEVDAEIIKLYNTFGLVETKTNKVPIVNTEKLKIQPKNIKLLPPITPIDLKEIIKDVDSEFKKLKLEINKIEITDKTSEASKKKLNEFARNYQETLNIISDGDLRAVFSGLGLVAIALADDTITAQEKIRGVAEASRQAISGTFNLVQRDISNNIADFDRLIERQKDAVTQAKVIADKGNSQLLDAENKKLQKLEELRRREGNRRKQALIAEAIANTALSITSALTTQPFLLGVAMAALAGVLGAVQIGVISAQQFKQGGQTPYGLIDAPSHENGGGKFSIRGRKDYVGEYEGGEYIFDRQTSAMNKDVFDVIRKHKINLSDVLANNSLKGFNFNPILSSTMVNQNGELESRLDAIEKAVLSLPDKMPRATFNADMYGLSMTVRETQIKETNWKR